MTTPVAYDDQEKISKLEDLIESILVTLESVNGSTYNPYISQEIQSYRNEMKDIIDAPERYY